MPEKKTLNKDLFYKGSSANLPHLHTCENKVLFWDFKEFAVTTGLKLNVVPNMRTLRMFFVFVSFFNLKTIFRIGQHHIITSL